MKLSEHYFHAPHIQVLFGFRKAVALLVYMPQSLSYTYYLNIVIWLFTYHILLHFFQPRISLSSPQYTFDYFILMMAALPYKDIYSQWNFSATVIPAATIDIIDLIISTTHCFIHTFFTFVISHISRHIKNEYTRRSLLLSSFKLPPSQY